MREEKIHLNSGPLILEGLLSRTPGERGVVICHPHSLMGGSMHNNVVETLQHSFASQHYSTLRFNFRGVGSSTGSYDGGKGEREDILASCDYLKKQGIAEISFAGYSFGAWVGSFVLQDNADRFSSAFFISPPIDYFDFDWEGIKNKIDLILCGDRDSFCSLDTLRSIAGKIGSPLEIIHHADHFYMGYEEKLSKVLSKHIAEKR